MGFLKTVKEKFKKPKPDDPRDIISADDDEFESISVMSSVSSISLTSDPVPDEVKCLSYYHGFLPRQDAEDMVIKVGDFLVRRTEVKGDSNKQKIWVIMITIRVDTSGPQQVDHITIPWSETKQAWECGEQNDFKKLDDFINKYMKAQRSIMDDDNRYKLKHPIPRHNWEVRHAQVVKQKQVGHGAYGEVWKGFVRIDDERFLTCAIKCLPEVMPRLKRKSYEQRTREAKEARKVARAQKKECVGNSVDSAKCMRVGEINAGGDGAERSRVVNGGRREDLVVNTSATGQRQHLVINTSTRAEGEQLVIDTSGTAEPLCDRLKNIALNSPHPLALPANESLPDVIAEHLQLVQAIIGSELGEHSLRDLVDPVGWLDAQTIYAYLEAVARSAAVAVVIVQPYIWMLRIANAESVAPYRYVRHYMRNYIDDWELLLVPIVLPGHHALGAYRRSARTFEYYDSLLNPISDETRAAVTGMLDVLHPGVDHVFVNSRDVVRQHDGSSCGVIACFTAQQLMAGRPTNDVAFDSSRFRQVIYDTLTERRAQRDGSAVPNTTHPTGIGDADTVASAHVVRGNAKVTRPSTARTRAAKRRGDSVEGSGTPKRLPTRSSARKSVPADNRVGSALRKRLRAASAQLPPSFSLGKMDKPCPNCAALHFAKESFLCCSGGRVSVPHISQPKLFKDLFGGLHRHSKSFLNNIRNINSLFAMASLTANEEHLGRGMQVYKISGELYVNVSALYERGPRPSYGNYYHYDVDEANQLRKSTERGAQLEWELLVDVDHCLRQNNQFCQMYMRFHEVFQNAVHSREDEGKAGEPLIRMRIVNVDEAAATDVANVHPGRLNPAAPGQVMAVFDAKDDGAPPDPRSRGTWVYPRNSPSARPLPHWSPDACPLLFPMLLPYGQRFYTRSIPVAKAVKGRRSAKRVSAIDHATVVEDGVCSDEDNTTTMDDARKQRAFVSHREFALFHYAYRAADNPHWLWAARRLAQQFVVYNHVCMESARLEWISQTWKGMRCDEAADLFRKVVDDQYARKGWTLGRVVILPATYPGSPRHMQRCFEDSIALVAEVGRPNYFITFTTNPKWPEIKGMLRAGERCVDQPMLVARVFHQYFSEFLNDLVKEEVLGRVVGFAYNTEFQKRGLPHVHLLLCVNRSDQVLLPEDIDDVIQAYIPPLPAEGEEDAEDKLELRRLVLAHMIHRPCAKSNFPCRTKEGLCSKRFPKPYQEHTVVEGSGYALLKRPNDGTVALLEDGKTVVTNRDVVPYSRYFLKKYHTHINIEHCASIECIKYIFKYIFKGYDCAVMQLMTKRVAEPVTEDVEVRVGENRNDDAPEPTAADADNGDFICRQAGAVDEGMKKHRDEDDDDRQLDAGGVDENDNEAAENNAVGVQVDFEDLPEEAKNDGPLHVAKNVVDYDEVSWARRMRVVTAPEACYRDCGYLMHRLSHAIVRLNFHLPGEKNVYFVEGEEAQALQRAKTRRSQLEAFFELNKTDSAAREYTYLDIPKHYRWDEKKGAWVRRVRKHRILTRIYTVKARFVEKFCLRMLLKYVKGPRCFEDIRTVAGRTYASFFEACVALGLSVAETVWEQSMSDVCAYNMPRQARQSFAALITFGAIKDAPRLWTLFKAQMLDRNARRTPEQKEFAALRHIQRILKAAGQDLNAYGIPFDDRSEPIDMDAVEVDMADVAEERSVVERMYEGLNIGQRTVVDRVLHAVQNSTPTSAAHRCFFLQGAGGTGKTHVYNLIIRMLRLRGTATVAVAFTGIAATLLIGGTTVHSRFQLPLRLHHDSVSSMKSDSDEAHAIRNAPLIIWDEACTQKRYALEAVERLLRDIAVGELKTAPFGGHVMLLGGDWRQMLPIVEDGTNEDTIAVTIRNSRLWPFFEVLHLNENMRTGPGEELFATFLQRLGNGELQDRETDGLYVKMPRSCCFDTEEDIVSWIYDNDTLSNIEALASRALLTVRNDDCNELNAVVLNRLKPEEQPVTYYATDVIDRDDPNCIVELMAHDYLNSTTPPGMPPHQLVLKSGAVVMLLRNIDVQAGLCNGTRLVVVELRSMSLLCRILTGTHAGEPALLTKLPIKYVGGRHDGGVCFTRTQFPIRLSFCMTINKSQGQTFERVGIVLRTPVFTHGQLYVALSRVRSLSSLRIYTTIPRRLEAFCRHHPQEVPIRNIVYKSMIDK